MEAFGGIDVGDQHVAAGAAATTGQLADALADKSVFLPLDDNPTQSVVSAVLSTETSPFPRSGAALGSLRSTVTEAEVVPTEGDDAGVAQTLRDGPLQDLLAGHSRAVITRLVFDGASKTTEAERWTQICRPCTNRTHSLPCATRSSSSAAGSEPSPERRRPDSSGDLGRLTP